MARLEALLFDVDGTLADTERDGHRVAFNRAFADAGLDWDWTPEIYGDLLSVTGGKERIRHFIDNYRPRFEAPDDLDAFIAELHAAKTAHYKRLLEDPGLPLRPGVERLLREARDAGLRLAIATTTTPENVTALLRNSLDPEAEGWFEVIAAGDIVPAKKPAPDIYLWAMERLGLPPERCMAFEDSGHGVRAARDAGLRSILVTVNDYTRDQDFDAATIVLDRLGDEGAPARVLRGPALAGDRVDLAALRALHDHAWG